WTEWTKWSPCLPKNDPLQNQGLRFRQRSCNAWNGKCGSSFSSISPDSDSQQDHQAENCDVQTTTISVATTAPGFNGSQFATKAAAQLVHATRTNNRPCNGQHYLYLDCNGYCINFRDLGYPNYPDCLRGGAKNSTAF
uniref:Uncharacterized protein n=1 Tax=Romanomermis culicivorax TaxID=13658 RepID=A0A915K4V6_ROMCU